MTELLVKERPILFSGAMVRALLNGTKTQTRREVKNQPAGNSIEIMHNGTSFPAYGLSDWVSERYQGYGFQDDDEMWRCPYGQPGDRLWVRETCRAEESEGLDGVRYVADNTFRPIENTRKAADAWVDLYHYGKRRGATVPPIHTPRWTSRLLLEIVSVRVERVQHISVKDVRAEGCQLREFNFIGADASERQKIAADVFGNLWVSINGPESWTANPWVWVVEFKVIEPAHG